jgi:hypothetical protein
MDNVRTSWWALVVVGGLFSLSGAPASIGIVRSYGEFRVDGAAVRGNSTLMAGDVVETMALNTTVNLGGTELTLLPESRAALYGDHTTLQRGTTLLRGTPSYALEVGNLRVVSTSPHSLLEVAYSDGKQIRVSARAGAADVFAPAGVLVASVNSGGMLSFGPESGAGTPTGQASATAGLTLHGVLTANHGKYFVTEGGKTYQLTSSTVNLAQFVGKIITTSGTVASTSDGVTVVSVAAVLNASAAGGMASAALAVTIVSMAAAGAVAGLGVSGAFGSGKGTVSVP